MGPSLVADLRAVVGDDHLLVDDDLTERFRVDWTGRHRAEHATVVRPATTDEVADVVRACASHDAPVCPQGGNTGLVGGSVPLGGEVVVSTRRLTRLDGVDSRAASVTVGAGVTLGDLHRHVAAAGHAYGVDLGARDSATVGGTIATNAGGNNVIRHGMTRAQLLGIEVVLADGSVVGDLTGLPKDNTGYDLAGLLCGSEGTLGIITAATLRVHRRLPERVTALVGFASVELAVAAVDALAAAHLPMEAAELMLDDGVELVRRTAGLPAPLAARHAAYLLVECADATPVTGRLAEAVAAVADLTDAAVADDRANRASLWQYRELHTEAVNAEGPPVKLDVSLPVGDVAPFIERMRRQVADELAGSRTWVWGHVGDGNLHVNVTGVPERDEARCIDLVLGLVLAAGGSVSAEHGIGRMKKEWLVRQRGEHDVAAMRAIKAGLDPAGLLQPEVLL